jgi:hypothetical protein
MLWVVWTTHWVWGMLAFQLLGQSDAVCQFEFATYGCDIKFKHNDTVWCLKQSGPAIWSLRCVTGISGSTKLLLGRAIWLGVVVSWTLKFRLGTKNKWNWMFLAVFCPVKCTSSPNLLAAMCTYSPSVLSNPLWAESGLNGGGDAVRSAYFMDNISTPWYQISSHGSELSMAMTLAWQHSKQSTHCIYNSEHVLYQMHHGFHRNSISILFNLLETL